jgi:hypothetical protein
MRRAVEEDMSGIFNQVCTLKTVTRLVKYIL